MQSNVAPCYGHREPRLTITGGEGRYIETQEHGRLFDATAGYWYNIFGMRHRELMQVKEEFAGMPHHIYEENTNPQAEKLARTLCELTGKESVVFATTGSMACENARKEAVHYHRANDWREQDLIFATIKGGYHGSVGEMLKWIDPQMNSLCVNSPCYKSGSDIAEIVGMFEEQVKAHEKHGKKVAGFFYEPVMGVRGAVELPKEYLEQIARICRERDILLIADEVTTGCGRIGTMFGYEYTGVEPDIICVGKGISAGYYPLSATVLDRKIVEAWEKLLQKGEPYSTLHRRGNGMAATLEACAVGNKVLEILERDAIVEQVREKGRYAVERFQPLTELGNVREVRGKGLLMAVDVANSTIATNAKNDLRKRGVNALPEGRMMMFCPAYTIVNVEIDIFAQKLEDVLRSEKK